MPSLFSNGHLLMRRLYLFWNRNVRNFAPVIQFFHTYAKSFFTPVPIPLSVEQCIDPDGYTRKESCYICPCTSKNGRRTIIRRYAIGRGGQFPGIPTGGSYKSSLGFYLTGNTYQGRNGYSLLLDGLEKGINDRARERAIVVHGAAYANPSVCKSGRLGRSFGCPALPQALTKPIINTIKGGSVLFIYANNKEYMAKSSILPNQTSQELFTEACESEQTVSAHL